LGLGANLTANSALEILKMIAGVTFTAEIDVGQGGVVAKKIRQFADNL